MCLPASSFLAPQPASSQQQTKMITFHHSPSFFGPIIIAVASKLVCLVRLQRTTMPADKKRDRSMFAAVEQLEKEDNLIARRLRKTKASDVARSRAALAQQKVTQRLLECRILLQRALQTAEKEETLDAESKDECDKLLQELLAARDELTGKPKREIQIDRLEDILQEDFDGAQERWKSVLDRRHRDVRLHSGQTTAKSQFRVMDSSFWDQVEATVQYEEGRDKEFNDSKLYQHLLQEFMSSSTSSSSGGTIAKPRATQNLKNEVDRRASKGRKIRYTVIPKLVNFTFPLSRPHTSELDQDAYFQSLFGAS